MAHQNTEEEMRPLIKSRLTTRLNVAKRNKFDPAKNGESSLPDEPGFYIVCLDENASPPPLPPDCLEPILSIFARLRVLYVGIAGRKNSKRR